MKGVELGLIISIVIMIIWLLFVGNISISFKPFSFHLPFWHRSLGIFLAILGFLIYNIGEHMKGYSDGLKKGEEMTWDAINKVIKDKKDHEQRSNDNIRKQ